MSPRALHVGATLGHFRIEGFLGQGGMGAVFLARDLRAGRLVALKTILAPDSEVALQRFVDREARVVAGLRHPGIVAVHDVFVHQGFACLVTERVEGATTLDQHFARASVEERIERVVELADALAYVHEQGLVHRDLKPENVLIDAEGRLRVTDFGLVFGAGLERLTQTGRLTGTPAYMAPEQAGAARAAIGAHTDVWALGVILYEALTERLPFEALSPTELLVAIVSQAPTPPERASPHALPPGVGEVCLRALEKDPEARYPNARAFQAALAAAAAGEYVSGASPARRVLGGLGALLLVAALLAGGLALGPSRDPTPLASASEAPSQERAQPTSAREWGELGLARLKARKLEEALEAFDRALEISPESERAAYQRGLVLVDLGREREGLRDLEAVLKRYPEDTVLLYRVLALRFGLQGSWSEEHDLDRPVSTETGFYVRGNVRAIAGRLVEAQADYTRAIQLSPTQGTSHWKARAAVRERLGDLRGALADLHAALRAKDTLLLRLETARLHAALGEEEAAQRQIEEALARDPKSARALMIRSDLAIERGDLVAAKRDLDHALELAPEELLIQTQRGVWLSAQGKEEEALAVYRALLEEHPEDPTLLHCVTASLVDLGRYREAEPLLLDLVTRFPQETRCVSNLAIVYRSTGRAGKALELARRASDLAPESVQVGQNLARSLSALGRTKEALAELDRVQALDPKSARTRYQRGKVLEQAGRLPEAAQAMGEAIGLGERALYYRERALVLAKLGRHAEAEGDLVAALRLEPSPLNLNARGFVRYRRGDLAGALADFDAAVAKDPRHPQARVNRVNVLKETNRMPEGIADLDVLVEVLPNEPYWRFMRGEAHYLGKDFDRACADLEVYCRARPKEPAGYLLLGRARAGAGEHERALAAYDQALSAQPRQPSALAHKADSLRALKRWREVVEVIDVLLPQLAPPQRAGVEGYRREALEELRKLGDARGE